MSKPIHKVCLWALPLLSFLCIGWAESWEALRAAAGEVTAVQADFVQEKHLPILARPLRSEGVFYYQSPQSLRWEYRTPLRSLMVMHDGRLRRFVSGPAGWSEEKGGGIDAMQFVMQEISQWLSGHFDESKVFQAQLSPDGRIVLTPREASMQKIIERIVLNLAEQPGAIESVLIYEGKDAYTRMTFRNMRLNQPIDSAVFQKVP